MYLIDLEGNEFMLEATTKKTLSLSGDRSLSFVVQPTKTNKAFIHDIGELWQLVDEEETEWTIIYAKSFGKGNSLSVEIKAVPRIFDYMNTNRLYEERDEHMTAFQCFEYIFEDTPYNFQLMDSFLAVQWQGFGGGKTILEQFKDALNRYDAEFTILGNEVRLYHQIGRNTEFMYHYKLNASNISKESDAEELWTYAKGFGDYETDEEPKLTREYRSPLADIVGVRHAPPFRDGRVKKVETMDQSLKELVDSSLKVSVTATLHDLREQGYPLAQPEPGDRVFLIDDRINLKEEMRVVDLEETRNQKGELLNVVITLGSEGLGKRRQADIKHALAEITEVVQGRRQLPLTALDNAVREATRKLLSADTEVLHTENGLEMVSKDDPNFIVIANSTGIGVSTDGGATFKNAITGDGVNTELLTAGTIDAQRVRITAGGENVLWVDSETGEVRMNVSTMSINFEPVATKKDLEEIELTPGEPGKDGKTAYEIAIENGFEGTEQEWLSSLEGEDGEPGKDATDWEIGEDGFWYEDGIKTDKRAVGIDGEDPDIWTIGDNGNWYKNGVDTGNPSQGPQGEPGEDGDPGEDGISVIAIDEEYYYSTSHTSLVGGDWTTSRPNWQNGKYLWIRTRTTLSDGDEQLTVPVNVTGAKGADGRMLYTWIKYADDAIGTGISDSPEGKKYIGHAYNKVTLSESTNPADYTWTSMYDIQILDEVQAELEAIEAELANMGIVNLFSINDFINNRVTDADKGKLTMTVEEGVKYTISTNVVNQSNDYSIWIEHDGTQSGVRSGQPVTFEARSDSITVIVNLSLIDSLAKGDAWIKLEKGEHATEWLPNAYDVQVALNSKADLQSVSDVLGDIGRLYEGLDEKLSYSDYEQFVIDYENRMTTLEQQRAESESNFANIQARTSAMEVNMGEFSSVMNFLETSITQAEEGILVAETGSETGILVGTDTITFRNNGAVVVEITGQALRINHGIFVESLQVDKYKFEMLPNSDIMAVQWVGG